MNAVQVLLVAVAIIIGLTGCASSHTRHHQAYATTHGKSSHSTSGHSYSKWHKPAGHNSRYKRPRYVRPAYVKPAPYTLPGGLQSVCTGGTPPPCN
ncbi:hypothetical protein [Acidisoma cladoniae]|jgi:uncharacterized lipoprotein|uniref:hypothetical protein n=1 Tax=Acidisoma cladoniae TaxID=3040935 RepID=UPI00254A786B|nr:hypothetical protein [Acidisoma sp. PAMC 29798]